MPGFRVEVKLHVTWKLVHGCRFWVHPATHQPFAVFPPQNHSTPKLFQSSTVLPTWCDFDLLCSRRSASSVPTPPAFMCNCASMCTTTVQLHHLCSNMRHHSSIVHHHSSIVHHHSSSKPPLFNCAPAQCNCAPPQFKYAHHLSSTDPAPKFGTSTDAHTALLNPPKFSIFLLHCWQNCSPWSSSLQLTLAHCKLGATLISLSAGKDPSLIRISTPIQSNSNAIQTSFIVDYHIVLMAPR